MPANIHMLYIPAWLLAVSLQGSDQLLMLVLPLHLCNPVVCHAMQGKPRHLPAAAGRPASLRRGLT
jgi:hypothetical protein